MQSRPEDFNKSQFKKDNTKYLATSNETGLKDLVNAAISSDFPRVRCNTTRPPGRETEEQLSVPEACWNTGSLKQHCQNSDCFSQPRFGPPQARHKMSMRDFSNGTR